MNSEIDPNPVTTEAQTAVWGRIEDVTFKAWVQFRYHKRRQGFFDLIDKGTKTATLLLGATLFGADIKTYLPYVASFISSLSLLALIFSYSERKQVHKELSEAYGVLLSQIAAVPPRESMDNPKQVASWCSEFVKIGVKAPPPLKRLTRYCEREQTLSLDKPLHPQHDSLRNGWYFLKYFF